MRILPSAIAACILASSTAAFTPRRVGRPTSTNALLNGASTLQLSSSDFSQAETGETNKEKSNTSWAKEESSNEPFENSGPLAWMQQYLDLAGIKPGENIAYGPFTTGPVKDSERISSDEASRRREEAAGNLQNIDNDERDRRLQISKLMTVATVAYAGWAALLGDQGDFRGHILRFLTFVPLMFTVGYRLSAETGL